VAPLVGQKSQEHVSENLEIMKIPPLAEEEYVSLVKKLTS
jgi:aryl-alcohol dehydrogenase-like predicted oxidoreductase